MNADQQKQFEEWASANCHGIKKNGKGEGAFYASANTRLAEEAWTAAKASSAATIRGLTAQLEAADEMVALLLSESLKAPLLPIEGADAWTDWITTALKNLGLWQGYRQKRAALSAGSGEGKNG